jgi:CHAD domain-containing protein
MDVDSLLELYRVDRAHARQVADHALALFDAVAGRYKLSESRRPLVELGALLHNVGLTTDPPEHHIVGRDIVLRHPLDGLDADEQLIVAAMVAFHRRKVRPGQEPAFLALGKGDRRDALALAAILRVADGLDYSQSQTTRSFGVAEEPGCLIVQLGGPHAAGDGARAVAKADLWARSFGEPLRAEGPDGEALTAAPGPEGDGAGEPGEAEAAALAPWYASPEAPLAELGRVLLRRNLRRMLAAERRVRADEEIEGVHDLRVATRRLRATVRLLTPVGPRSALRRHGKAMGRLARAAGAVRDRDVLLADLDGRVPTMPEALKPSAGALRAALRAERDEAHRRLVAYLDRDDHRRAVKAFAATMVSVAGWDDGVRVRDLGGSTIWRHYEALRAHDRGGLPREDAELHEMRIEGKRLRYVLELFADTFGPRAAAAVAALASFQDHLGGLNDIAVAGKLLAPFLDDAEAGPATAAYLALREQQGRQLRDELPARWGELCGEAYRRGLMELVAGL